MFKDAVGDARKLDDIFKKNGEQVGPIHSLPITFKVQIPYPTTKPESDQTRSASTSKATITVMATSRKLSNPSTHTTYVIDPVKTAGAVIVVKTNGPQTMLVAESDNNLFKQAKNALIFAAPNGVYGYRSTCGLLPFIRCATSGYTRANSGIGATLGPIDQLARDLSLFTRVVQDAKPWLVDLTVVPNVSERGTFVRKHKWV
ncbi:hypothetical protein BUE80_DR008603 [Diplocarpon rosae]|nr:hypothetical protein BUE80_DR008603 [Diplocarpon rosae]